MGGPGGGTAPISVGTGLVGREAGRALPRGAAVALNLIGSWRPVAVVPAAAPRRGEPA